MRLEDGAGDTSTEGDAVGEALGLGVVVACGVLLVVGAGLVGVVAGAEVVGATVDDEPVPDGEELAAGGGLKVAQVAMVTTKTTIRIQVEVRVRRIARISQSRAVLRGRRGRGDLRHRRHWRGWRCHLVPRFPGWAAGKCPRGGAPPRSGRAASARP